MQAFFICKRSDFCCDVRLYRVEPPIAFTSYFDVEPDQSTTEYVLVCADENRFAIGNPGPMTYIRASDSNGIMLLDQCGLLKGSYDGGLDHTEALRRAGYEVQE